MACDPLEMINVNDCESSSAGSGRFFVALQGNLTGATYTDEVLTALTDTYPGAVLTTSTIVGGSGYTAGSNVATTGGTGTGLTVNTTVSSGAITAIVINNAGSGYTIGDVITVSGGTGGTFVVASVSVGSFVELKVNKDGIMVTPNTVSDPVLGYVLTTITAEVFVTGISAAKRKAINKLTKGQPKLTLLWQSRSGEWWIAGEPNGENEGAWATIVDNPFGKAKTDEKGYRITFVSEQNELPVSVDPTLVATLI